MRTTQVKLSEENSGLPGRGKLRSILVGPHPSQEGLFDSIGWVRVNYDWVKSESLLRGPQIPALLTGTKS